MPDLSCWGGQIVEDREDGTTPRIVLLQCKCGAEYWSTKNIGYIGARTIFFHSGGCKWMQAQHKGHECNCPPEDLRVAKDLMKHVDGCEECKRYGY